MNTLSLMSFTLLISVGVFLSLYVLFTRVYLHRLGIERTRYFGLSCVSLTKHSLFRFLGVAIDIWGVLYYLFLAVSFAGALLWGGVFWAVVFFVVVAGALFSIYFILLQTLVVKIICKPILLAVSVPLFIFGTFFFFLPTGISGSIQNISGEIYLFARVFSVIGLVLAGFSFSSFLFFMEDMRISSKEARKLSFISEGILLFVMLLLVLTVMMMFAVVELNSTQLISFSLSLTLVAGICEFIKTARIRPALVFMSLKKNKAREEKELLKRLAFGIDGISITSWIFIAFLFFVIPEKEILIDQIVGLYVLLVMIAFLLSQLVSSNVLYGNDK